jgi:hypothetical protein
MHRLRFQKQNGRSPNFKEAKEPIQHSSEINECLDHEIEDFLVLEDPKSQGHRKKVIVLTEPHDFVTKFPSCLKGKEGFSGISPDQKKIVGKIDTPLFDCALHRPAISPVQCDLCFHWIERYYIDIPILQAQIKLLTSQNDLLMQENRDLKAHIERKTKRIKRSRNIVIKNETSVKAIINSELPDSLLAQGQTRGSTLQQCTKKTLTTEPFGNTYKADEVSPEVEAGVVAGLRCLQP